MSKVAQEIMYGTRVTKWNERTIRNYGGAQKTILLFYEKIKYLTQELRRNLLLFYYGIFFVVMVNLRQKKLFMVRDFLPWE